MNCFDLLTMTFYLSGESINFKQIKDINREFDYLLEFNPYFIRLISEIENKNISDLRKLSFKNKLRKLSFYLKANKDKIKEDYAK